MKSKVELVSNFKKFEQILEDATKKALLEAGSTMKAEAERLVPVDTGNLRSSINFEVDSKTGELTLYAEETYAAAVEFGTSKQKAQPFLQPAFEKGAAEISANLKKTMNTK